MRSFICYFVIFSVLFVSLESAADVVMDGFPHGDDASHQEEFGHQLDAHEEGTPDRELDGEHCNHCCHGHSAGITAQVSPLTTPFISRDRHVVRSAHVRSFGQAPPTPPPNA